MTNTPLSPFEIVKDNINLELFFELSGDLLCIAGFDGYFKRINPTVSKVLGYTNDELFARLINDFIHIEDQSVTAEKRVNLTNNIPLLNFENRYITKTGETVWLSWTSISVASEKLIFAIAKNITYKRKIEDDRNSLLANLSKINGDLKLINYTTSHDLRAPVNNLLSIFSLLDITKIQHEETLEFIDLLKMATENLKTTLNNYVDTLNEKDCIKSDIEEIDLRIVLDMVLSSLKSLIRESKTIINIDFSVVKKVNFTKACLESVFLNLITNSIKYTKPNNFPRIHIYSELVNGDSRLIFVDEGLGFDMDKVKDKIFHFNQKFHHHPDSKGIGLYLIHNHIVSLGGSITVESKLNEGAKFTISFMR
jgi:PAS domain S-box-containing protein